MGNCNYFLPGKDSVSVIVIPIAEEDGVNQIPWISLTSRLHLLISSNISLTLNLPLHLHLLINLGGPPCKCDP